MRGPQILHINIDINEQLKKIEEREKLEQKKAAQDAEDNGTENNGNNGNGNGVTRRKHFGVRRKYQNNLRG